MSITNGAISSGILKNGEGDGRSITIDAGILILRNTGFISSSNAGGIGNAGNINIKTTGNLAIAGNNNSTETAGISSSTSGKGNAGKITVATKGKLSMTNGSILSAVLPKGDGYGEDITIAAGDLSLINNSYISDSNTGGVGNAGNINIKVAGNLSIAGANNPSVNLKFLDPSSFKDGSGIDSLTAGKGNAGKITIDTKGKLSLDHHGGILSAISEKGQGNSLGIKISAGDLSLTNSSLISSNNLGGIGNAGDIEINTTGNLTIIGSNTPSVINKIVDIKVRQGILRSSAKEV